MSISKLHTQISTYARRKTQVMLSFWEESFNDSSGQASDFQYQRPQFLC